MEKIIVDVGIKKQIKEELTVSYKTVSQALFGMTKTDLAKRIRAKALELGGVEVPQK